ARTHGQGEGRRCPLGWLRPPRPTEAVRVGADRCVVAGNYRRQWRTSAVGRQRQSTCRAVSEPVHRWLGQSLGECESRTSRVGTAATGVGGTGAEAARG